MENTKNRSAAPHTVRGFKGKTIPSSFMSCKVFVTYPTLPNDMIYIEAKHWIVSICLDGKKF